MADFDYKQRENTQEYRDEHERIFGSKKADSKSPLQDLKFVEVKDDTYRYGKRKQ